MMESWRSKSPKQYEAEERRVHKKRKLSSSPSVDNEKQGDSNKGSLKKYLKNSKTIEILQKKGIQSLFPIQSETFRIIYQKNDLIARDRTGSGKTLAFSLPIIQRFRDNSKFSKSTTKFLIVLPTRQLAAQVKNEISSLKYNSHEFQVLSVYGGTDISQQIYMIEKGVDIIVSTPGRLIDLLQRGVIKLYDLEVLCLDQADEMLKQGFQEQIQKIFEFIKKHTNKKTQNLLFSATLPQFIMDLSRKYLSEDRKYVDLIKNSQTKTSKTIQHLSIFCSNRPNNIQISNIVNHYAGKNGRAIIFTQTKKQANEIGSRGNLRQQTHVLHGDIPQRQRQYTFRAFRQGRIQCLVATNVAARGLDIPQVDVIIQVQPPKDAETYIHRSGRTGRAGKSGVCVTFYNYNQAMLIQKIQRIAQIRLKNIDPYKLSPNQNMNKQYNFIKKVQEQSKYVKHIQPPQYQRNQIKYEVKKSNIPPESQVYINQNKQVIPKFLNSVKDLSSQIIPYFAPIAKQIIESIQSPVQNLAKMLAYIDNVSKNSNIKSLLTGNQDYITYIIKTPNQFQGIEYVINFLKAIFSELYLNQIKQLKKIGYKQAAFDFHSKYSSDMSGVIEFLKYSEKQFQGFRIQIASQLPSIKNQNNTLPEKNDEEISEYQIRQAYRRRKQLQIYIGGLPINMNEPQVNNFLRSKKIVPVSVKLLRSEQGDFRGVAFVICLNNRSLKNALDLNGQKLGSRTLKINIAANR